jgi:hypothetical protein
VISSGGAFNNNAGATLTVNAGGSMLVAGGFSNAGTITNQGTMTVNTNPLSNAATGVINNEATWNQFIGATNDGIFCNKAGSFTCPQVFTNNKTAENRAGATWILDFGGTFTNATGSSLTNAGTFRNLSTFTNNTTVTNTGTFQNNGTHNCNGVFNNNGSGRLESTATVNVVGRINNAATATIESSFRFNILTNGYVSNLGTFINRDQIDIKANATYCNEIGSSLTGQFGSSIINAGYFKVSVNSTVTKNGSLTNSKRVDILGTYDAQAGSQIINQDTLCVAAGGVLKSVNIINNSGVWISKGTTENNGGSTWTNTGKIMVEKGGVIQNNFDLINRSAGSIINSGTLSNTVRLTNEGSILNNAYLITTAEIFNKTGATLTNTEAIFLSEGSLTNEGSFVNQKTTLISTCAVLSNKAGATINNTGCIESQGTTLQRGNLTGNAIVQQGGFVHTSASSNAPSVCKPSVRAGTDIGGNAKVDAAAVVAVGFGLDECTNIGYFVGGVARITYGCSDVGRTISNIPVKLVLRTGDSLTCTTSVEVFDNVAPVFTNCPKDATVFSIADSAAYTWATVTATDNCSTNINFTSSKASGSNFPIGTTMVTISARDTFGNVNDCMFRVTVRRDFVNPTCPATDDLPPVFTNCPASQTLSTQNGYVAATWTDPSVSDNCYPIVVQQNFNSGQLFQVGSTTVIYTARDSKNNTATCSFTITVNGPADICTNGTDNIKPAIRNCPANFFGVVNTAINGAVGVWRMPTATDNCGFVNLTSTAISGQIFPVGTTAVTYTATDARNNTATCQFNVLVSASNPCAGDVTPPNLTCPANVTVNTTNGSAAATWTAPNPTDACEPVTINATHQPGQVFLLGSTTVNYYASDRVGNQATCGFLVTVVNACLSDTIRPTITNCPANITVTSTNGTTATATWTTPSVSDNCSGAMLTSNFASGSTFSVGTTTVMYTATDARGNQSNCTFTVTVNRSTVVTCTGNIILNPSFENNFTDWFTTDVTTVSIINDVNSGAKAARLCGDNKPVLSKLNTLLGGTYTASAFAKVTGGLTTGVIGIEFYDANGIVLPTARITRPITATSYTQVSFTFTKPSNATSFAFLINKTGVSGCICVDDVCITNPCTNDTQAPTLSACPANIVRNLTDTTTSTLVNWTAPTASDNCGTPSVISNFAPNSRFALGTTTVRYTATDPSGNTATCTFTITVNNPCAGETTPPSFGTTCPTNRTATSTNGACVAVTWIAPTATDNCGTPSVTTTHAPNFCFPVGTTTVTYTATDLSNNKATCSFTVTVSNACATETTPPSFTYCPPAQSKVTATTTAVVSWTNPAATDNCSTPNISAPVTSPTAGLTNGGNFPVGSTTVTYTATDARGNKATCSFVVTVTRDVCLGDVTAPSFGTSCPANITRTTTNNACVVVNFTAPTATDNCGTPSVSGTHATNFCFPVGTTAVTFTAVDSKNNQSSCRFTVTINNSTTTACTRVSNGILALYDFKEGSGSVVRDKSGVGTPLDLTIAHPANTNWIAGGCGLRINSATIIKSNTAATKLNTTTNSITVEAWVKPANTTQDGPARIVSYSENTSSRNFTLGQVDDTYIQRLRTTSTNTNGMIDGANILTGGVATTQLQHLVFTRDFSSQQTRLYVNGVQVASGTLSGNFSNWETDNYLALANELTMDRTWLGEMYLVAVYNRSLTVSEISQNYSAGACCATPVCANPINLAQGKPATQASNYNTTATANKAVDGNTDGNFFNGSVTHTQCGNQDWWQVDLGSVSDITTIRLWNRTDCCADRLANFYVFVSDVPFTSTTLSTTLTQSGVSHYYHPNAVALNTSFTINRKGRYVRVQLSGQNCLSLAEVQVLGCAGSVDPCIAAPSVGGTVSPASQSISTAANGVVPTRHTLSGHVGTVVRWEYCQPNSTTWVNWNGGGSTTAPNNCCFNTVGTWKVRAIVKNGTCAEVASSVANIIVTQGTTPPVSCTGNTISNFSFESDLMGYNNWGNTTISTTDVRSGNKAASIGTAAGGFGYDFNVSTLSRVSFTSHNKITGTPEWAGVGLTFYDANWVKIPNGEYTIAITTTTYTPNMINVPVPAGAVHATAWSWKSGTTGKYLTDDWCLVLTPKTTTTCYTASSIIVERWNTMSWNFPIQIPTSAPAVTNYQGNTQGAWNIGDNYTTRVRGYIKAPTTGAYVFNVTGDDNVEFFLSTNTSPANMTRRAYIQGWTNETEYYKFPSQHVTGIQLTAGQYYYFEIRHVEGGGGDGWRLSWCPPGVTTLTPIQAQYLARPCNNSTTFNLAQTRVFEFSAKADLKTARLQWLSNGGLEHDFYEIERANAQGVFEKIGLLNANTGDDKLTVFNFTDLNPLEGENFYRIKTILTDKITPQYSAIKSLIFKDLTDISVYPNPANDILNLDLKAYEGRAVSIYLYNAMGQMTASEQIDKATALPFELPISSMPVGSYRLRIAAEGKRDLSKTIIINR